MVKILILLSIFVFTSVPLLANDPFSSFNDEISAGGSVAQNALNNLAKDLGALLGGGSYHEGKSLGFPGFDIGIQVPTKSVSNDDSIVQKAGVSSIALPIVQAEIGLPANIDLIGRYTSYLNATLTGFGLRYGLFKPSIPGMPSVSVQAVMTNLAVASGDNKFKASTTGVNAIISFDHLPVITPYAGVGFDSTDVEPDSSSLIKPAVSSFKGTASGTRIEAGINLTLFPFTYLKLGAAMAGGSTDATAGIGVSF